MENENNSNESMALVKVQEQKNQELMRLAQRRVQFKKNVLLFAAVNIFLWLYYFSYDSGFLIGIKPFWVTLIWGAFLVNDYFSIYKKNEWFDEEKEYQKILEELKNKK